MRRLVRAGVALALAAGAVFLGIRAPEAVSALPVFRVERVEVEGVRYLEADEVRAAAAVADTASVWDPPEAWEERVRSLRLVREAEVSRRLPSSLVVRIVEREPVALFAAPLVGPVDAEGRLLPIDPAEHRLDLPLLVAPTGRRAVAAEAARLATLDPDFLSMVSELRVDAGEGITARWGDPAVSFRFHPPLSAPRIREGMAVLADASARRPDARVAEVDLRWADQVVVRYHR